MTKRLVFWLVLACMIASSAIMSSAVESGTPLLTTDKVIATAIDVKELEAHYENVFFGKANSAGETVLVQMNVVRDYSISEPLAHILSGSVLDKSNMNISDPYAMLMYIKTDKGYQPLLLTETLLEKATNKVEGLIMLYAKVKLLNLGKDVFNDVRLVVFKKSDAKKLILGENLQITDMRIVARHYTFVERVKISLNNIVDSVTSPR